MSLSGKGMLGVVKNLKLRGDDFEGYTDEISDYFTIMNLMDIFTLPCLIGVKNSQGNGEIKDDKSGIVKDFVDLTKTGSREIKYENETYLYKVYTVFRGSAEEECVSPQQALQSPDWLYNFFIS